MSSTSWISGGAAPGWRGRLRWATMTRCSVPARWLLLCALALAVVAMHHAPAGPGPVEMASMAAELDGGAAPAQGGARAEVPQSEALAAARSLAEAVRGEASAVAGLRAEVPQGEASAAAGPLAEAVRGEASAAAVGLRAEAAQGAAPAAAGSLAAAGHVTSPAPDHGGGHDPLHLCLAILAAMILLAAAALLAFRTTASPGPLRRPILRRAARPPPSAPAGRLLLVAHCVLRI